MAAEGVFGDAVAAIQNELAAIGIRSVIDPRQLGPRQVFVQLPTFVSFNNNISDITVKLQVVAAPPGNNDAFDWILSTVDRILQSGLAVVDGLPITLVVGELELPAYELTIRLATRRN